MKKDMLLRPVVHVAGTAYIENSTGYHFLVSRRAGALPLFPNMLEGFGGNMVYGETFVDAVVRKAKEEFGITVVAEPDMYLTYYIPTPTGNIPGLRFLCRYEEGRPFSNDHYDTEWWTEKKFRETDPLQFVGNMKEQTLLLVTLKRALERSESDTP